MVKTKIKNKELLFSLTKKDFRFDYYKGEGAGGQKKNKTENCCRCTHIASKATAKSEKGRSKEFNKKEAFRKVTETKEFLKWINLEASKVTGELSKIENKIEKTLREDIKTEIKINGKWTEVDKNNLNQEGIDIYAKTQKETFNTGMDR